MNRDLPDELREYIRTKNKDLADRADTFWREVTPILDRQSRPGSNENGRVHVTKVELNAWRLIKYSGKVSDFSSNELFLLSCGACSHDFDKGLFYKLPDDVEHGKGSGDFLIKEYRALQKNFHEMVAIKQIIGIHDLPDGKFQDELKSVDKKFSLSTGPVKLQKLAVILKTADILHTDSSRIASVGIDTSTMEPEEKKKQLARESISGWDCDGSRVIINAVPESIEHLEALKGCIKYIEEIEWPAVEDKLSDYDFPCQLEFKINDSICGDPPGLKKKTLKNAEHPGKSYSQDNHVFNVPYREKGDGVVGREDALQKLRTQLTKSRGTAIGQTASFHGMGGLGKTQLAVEYAHRFKKDYPKGVIWINADQEIDSQLIQIAKKGIWISPESEHKLILEIAQRRLATYSECLIIFDNVNNLEDIKIYLPESHATPHLILTSRTPQPGFEPINLNVLDSWVSLNLLLMEAGRNSDPQTPEEKDAAQEIVKELGGLPLAIELAGAYLKYLSSFSFVKYLAVLKDRPKSAMDGKMISSFTDHESDLFKTLKVTEPVFEKEPLLKDILNVLTWSGSSFMGISLLSAILNKNESDLYGPLSFGTELRILRKDDYQDRYEIHRLLRKVYQEEFTLKNNREWAENVCNRLGPWFESRRENFSELAEYELEIDHLKQWFENAKEINSIHDSRFLWLQAYPSYHWGKYDEALELVKSALDLYEKKNKQDTEFKAHIINDLGSSYGNSGNYTKQLELHDRALKIREEQLGPDHLDTAISLNNVGSTYGDLGEYKKALEFLKRALKIREKQFGPDHPDTALSLNNVGLTYGDLGEHKKALEFLKRALKIREKQLGPDHPDTASSLNNVGGTYCDLGDHKKALEFQERALKIREKQLGPDHPDTAGSLNNVIFALTQVKDFLGARKLIAKYSKCHNSDSLKNHINRESIKTGFRPLSSKKIKNNKKTRRSKKRK
jgi:tetratricopeptide (TPR) repeat protein